MKFFRENRFKHYALLLLAGVTFVILTYSGVRADDLGLEEIERQIVELQSQLQSSISATEPLEEEVEKLQAQISSIQAKINMFERERLELESGIEEREGLVGDQLIMLRVKVRDYYKNTVYYSEFLDFITSLMGSDSVSDAFRNFEYKEKLIDEDKKTIIAITKDILQLEDDKKQVEEDKARLASSQAKLNEQKAFFDGEIAGAKAYQSELSGKIATLTAQQQDILAQKLGSLNLPTTLGAGSLICTDDRNLNPGFSPAFAFYTYGIPHRVGMNQYGAYGRAEAGQDYKTILNAYFNNVSIECRDMPSEIVVDGYGSMNMDEYVKGVVNKEMGADLSEALKAQAVAARSYALATTNNAQSSICATQSCQVYSDGRRSATNDAVDATSSSVCGSGKAEVLVSGGVIIKAWYASTSGGYTFNSGDIWSTTTSYTKRLRDTNGDVGGWDDLQNKAYDRESPCFYAAQGWRGEYDNSAWLKSEEVADIANVILLVRQDSSAACFVYQTDKPPPPPDPAKGCSQTGNWSADEVRQKLGGQALSTATSVEVTGVDWGIGRTTQVKINGISFDGNEFKNYFNLRAPANIQIVGPLFNVERK